MAAKDEEDRLQIIVKELLDWAAYPDVCYFHPQNEGKRSKLQGWIAKAKGMLPGTADWIIVCRGHPIAIELKPKRKRGKRVELLAGEPQSEAQQAFEKNWKAAGGSYYLCHGYAETVEKLEWLRIIKPVKGSSRFEPRIHAA